MCAIPHIGNRIGNRSVHIPIPTGQRVGKEIVFIGLRYLRGVSGFGHLE